MCVCVYMRVCVCACVCALAGVCVCMCEHACLRMYGSILTTTLHESFTSIPKCSKKALGLRDYNKTAIKHA